MTDIHENYDTDAGGSDPAFMDIGDPKEHPKRDLNNDLHRHREAARSWVTKSLMIIFAGVLFIPIIAVCFFGFDAATAERLVSFSLPSVTAILGTAVGFYLNQQS